MEPPGGSADVGQGGRGHARNISSYLDVSTSAHRPQANVDRQPNRRAATVLGLEARRDKVDRPARAHACSEPRNAPNCAQVAEGQCADIVVRGWRHRGNPEIRGALPYVLGTTKDGVLLVEVDIGLEHDAVRRLPRADRVVRPPDERARPLAVPAERLRRECGHTIPAERLVGMQDFRAVQEGVPGRDAPALPRVDGPPGAVRIESPARVVEARAMVVRLAAVEPRRLELHRAGEHTNGDDPERDMSAILPMVGNRSQWIVGGRGSVWEGDGSNGGLTGGREIEREPDIPGHRPLVQRRELHEEV